MIEIFAIYLFCKNLGKRIRARGFSPFWWQALIVVFWFLGEFLGAIMATVIAMVGAKGPAGMGPAYLGAIIGALVGASLAFMIGDRVTKSRLATAGAPAFPVELDSPPPPIEQQPPQQVNLP